jgi:hypothetical protein
MPFDGLAVTGNEADYLKLPFAWSVTERFDHGQAREYQLPLGGDGRAILQLVPARGWALTVVSGPGSPSTARGLFGTPRDALMVLAAEHVFASFKIGGTRVQSIVNDRPMAALNHSVLGSTAASSPR